VPDITKLEKAVLQQLDTNFKKEINKQNWCTVQFNPESLKVSFANQLEQPKGAGDQRGSAARQFVGSSTTKLALTLWFDIGSPQSQLPESEAPRVDDVRKLTEKVAFFIKPESVPGKKQKLPPAVRFRWGTFQFDGVMDSLEETLEFFSSDGKPLRASLAVTLSQQDFQFAFPKEEEEKNKAAGAGTAGTAGTPGTKPLAQAPAGSSVQGLADAAGRGGDWQSIAAANGIENPRALVAGALLDLDLQAPTIGIELGLEGGLAVASPALSLGAGAGIGISGGFGASASVGIGG
jgi:hypothetical protein